MLLLSGHSLTAARKVPLDAMSLQLSERDSSASITPADMTGITVASWFQDDTEPGKGIVWRVKSIRRNYGNNTTQIQLEHAVNVLKDRIIFGEKKPADITGKKNAKTCTAREAILYILKQQGDWTLGTCDFNVSNPYKFDGDTLYEALEKVSNSLEGCWWDYDFSEYPFKINIKRKSSDIGTVMRAGRNMTALSRNTDKSGMFTRFYAIGKADLHISGGGYVEKNADKYGVISKVETDQTIDTEAELKRWANERLSKHAEPVVTIDVEGQELSSQTGEPLDKIVLGRKCMIPLPDFGEAEILETVTAMNYQDKLFKPESVRITLANKKNDVTKILAEEIRKGGGGGRAAARQKKEDNAWFEDTNEHVAMCAKGIVGVDAQGNPNWTIMSQIWVDGTGISQKVTSAQNGVDHALAQIDILEGEIDLKVSKNGVIAAINLSPEQGVKITATKVDLGDYATVGTLEALRGDFNDLTAGNARADSLKTKLLDASVGFNYQSHAISFKTVEATNGTFHLMGY